LWIEEAITVTQPCVAALLSFSLSLLQAVSDHSSAVFGTFPWDIEAF
jgi:hypothetical protein